MPGNQLNLMERVVIFKNILLNPSMSFFHIFVNQDPILYITTLLQIKHISYQITCNLLGYLFYLTL
jgi:hypothetical protein